MAVGTGSLAGYARVAYEATGLADFTQDNARAASSYRETTRDMTDETIRLKLAQDNLERQLRKGPNAYRAQARAELQLRSAERALRGETDQLTRSQARNQAGLGGLRRSVVGLASGYVGAHGLITLTRTSLNAAREEELVRGQTRVALEAAGVAQGDYAEQLDRTIARVQQLGFDDEDLAKSFQVLARSAKDPIEALEQLDLVADLVRGRYIDVEAATQIVNKANLSMAGGIRRLGIDVDKNAKSTELLAALNRSYGRSAEEAADSGVAAADRFAVATEEIAEAAGRGLAPAAAEASERITEWISKEENLERVQRGVTEAVEAGEVVVRGLGNAFEFLDAAVIGPLKSLGLLEEAVTAALIYGIVKKSGLAAIAIGGIQLASRRAAVGIVADNALIARSYDGVTAAAGRAAIAAGSVGVRGGRVVTAGGGGRRGIPPVLLGNPAIIAGTAVISAGGGGTQRGDRSGQYPTVYEVVALAAAGQASAPQLAVLRQELGGYSLANAPDDRMRRAERRLLRLVDGGRAGRGRPGHTPRGDLRERGTASGGGGGGGGGNRFTFGRYTSQIAGLDEQALDAASTPGQADDLRVERARLALARRALRELELTRDQRMQVKQARNAALQAIAAIEQAEEQESARIQEERARRAAAAKARADRRLDAILDAAERTAANRGKLLSGTGGSRANMRAQALRHVDEVVAGVQGQAGADRPLTASQLRAELNRMIRDLNSLREFGSNFADGTAMGRVATNASAQTDILMEQSRQLGILIRGQWHPGAWYAGNELAVAGTGVGF